MASSKISDYHVEKVIGLFAARKSATEAIKEVRLSYVTVRKLYELFRRRLIEVGYFSKSDFHAQVRDDDDVDENLLDAKLRDIQPALGKRRGVTRRTKPDHIAELLFHLEDAHGLFRERHSYELELDMKKALRLSGPLNRPLRIGGFLRATDYLLDRQRTVRRDELANYVGRGVPQLFRQIEQIRVQQEAEESADIRMTSTEARMAGVSHPTEERLEQLIATWIEGPNDNLDDLSSVLMNALDETKPGGEASTPFDTFYYVEAAIRQMEPTLLNLHRIIRWRRDWASHAAHEALLTTFWDMLNPEQQARYWIEANQQWLPEVIQGWLGEEVIAERSAYIRTLSDKS